jgi:hypothetical protein
MLIVAPQLGLAVGFERLADRIEARETGAANTTDWPQSGRIVST